MHGGEWAVKTKPADGWPVGLDEEFQKSERLDLEAYKRSEFQKRRASRSYDA
jgi:hypothetical protein